MPCLGFDLISGVWENLLYNDDGSLKRVHVRVREIQIDQEIDCEQSEPKPKSGQKKGTSKKGEEGKKKGKK
jgi:hypothetical protein